MSSGWVAGDAAGRGAGGLLTVLGCDGSYPGPGGAASGYLVESGGVPVWLDAGPGTFAALQLVTDPARLGAVILSHEHPDHWTDVESYCVWLRQHRAGPVPVYAPPGLRERSYFADAPEFDWRLAEPGRQVALRPAGASGGAGLDCTFAATDHGPPTLAVRFDPVGAPGAPADADPVVGPATTADPAAALAYSADTGPDWSVGELGQGLGLVLCEATFTADLEGEGRHLSGRQAGRLAREARVARLVLTHRRPSVAADAVAAEAEVAFGGPVAQAVAGRVFTW